jgi:choline dehydrogenase-like flavoprotein
MDRDRLSRPAEDRVTIPNPYPWGIARGWRIVDASRLTRDVTVEADVAIVGTGAGGGMAAEILARQGLRVAMIEEGALRTSSDFHMLEREAYAQLYFDTGARRTKDKGITILQGRTVGGSTTVNWTTSFRTPASTLSYWQTHDGLTEYTLQDLTPWFERAEQRLRIAPWSQAPNENNAMLLRGAAALGVAAGIVSRDVRGCQNLGYCGMGCPVNAKQSMLVTTIPAALRLGAVLVTRARAERFANDGQSVTSLACSALDESGLQPGPHRVFVRAHAFVCAAGGIGTPALLLRSGVPNDNGALGKRTFLHPTVISIAQMPRAVDAFAGAPQSAYSDAYLDVPLDGPAGFKLEVAPVHPVLMATTLPGYGAQHASLMTHLPQTQATIASLRDGFHAESPGGNVTLGRDGEGVLDYRMTPYLWEAARRALHAMAELQFAAGASAVMPIHDGAQPYASLQAAQTAIDTLPMVSPAVRVMSAHVMGGCAMSADPSSGVVDATGRHHQLGNLYVFDASVFPTSLGANPQLTVYALAMRNAGRLADLLNAGS